MKSDTTVAVGAPVKTITYPLGSIILLCSSNQLLTQFGEKDGPAVNSMSISGSYVDNDTVRSIDARGISSIPIIGSGTTRLGADLTVADADTGTFGTLKILAKRTTTECRWQIQYIP